MSDIPRRYKLFWGSSYDRGLDLLLKIWSDIKGEVPDATLDICYGWVLFDKAFFNNPERQSWKDKMIELMKQPGIVEHGRVGKEELKKIRSGCGIWSYFTNFDEINCITALEAQNDKVVPVVIDKAALQETVGSGVKVDGDPYMRQTREDYKNALIHLMKDEEVWQAESEKAKEFAKNYSWELISKSWAKEFGYGKPKEQN